nr:probable manganese-transporting ATPase PDR2 [Tanacetum cinerariifolium]
MLRSDVNVVLLRKTESVPWPFVTFKCFLHYTKVADVHLANACKVTTFAQIVPLHSRKLAGSLTEEMYFDFQKQRFIYSHEKGTFYKLPYPTKETFGYYLSSTGYDTDAQIQNAADKWGRKVIEYPAYNFPGADEKALHGALLSI